MASYRAACRMVVPPRSWDRRLYGVGWNLERGGQLVEVGLFLLADPLAAEPEESTGARGRAHRCGGFQQPELVGGGIGQIGLGGKDLSGLARPLDRIGHEPLDPLLAETEGLPLAFAV